MKSIEITVSPAGETSVETKGFTGSDCFAASEFIENSLGKQTKHLKTAEFFAASNNLTQQQAERESS